MRIISGEYGGRTIQAPPTSATRPLTDKVRAALFDSLGDVQGSVMLDAYAGSGAAGIEALSRGAAEIVAIESNPGAQRVIKENLRRLGVTWGYSLYESTVESWLARHSETKQFDLIVADPPYVQLKTDVLEKLGGLLVSSGILVVSHSSRQAELELDGLHRVVTKTYGDTALSFYKPA